MRTLIPARDRFDVVRPLGEGAAGAVYEAIDRRDGQRVAVKWLRVPGPDAVHRFKREFRLLADLAHPNLVRMGELISQDGEWLLTMELVEGTSFVEWVRAGGGHEVTRPQSLGFDEDRLRSAMRQLGLALVALHEVGLAHRDLKPANVRVTEAGRVVLLDFGLVGDTAARHDWSEDQILGTPAYMAPEQAAAEPATLASDCFAAGVVLFESLTGRLPQTASSSLRLLERRRTEQAPLPSTVVAGIPGDLDALCGDLLALDPLRRPTSNELVARLGGCGAPIGNSTHSRLHSGPLFVGRILEVGVLDQALEHVCSGETRLVAVSGESGIGKTAIVRRFLEELRLARQDALVLRSACFAREAVAFKAFDGAMDSATGFLAQRSVDDQQALTPRDAWLLAQVFPVMLKLRTFFRQVGEVLSPDPHETRLRAFTAMRELLGRLAARHLVVLSIDDLHWADADSLALLEFVFRSPGAPRMLIVWTTRPEGRDLLRALEPVQLEITGLGPEDSAELVTRLARLRGPGVSPPDGAALVRGSGGHPLLLTELLMQGASDTPMALDEILWSRIQRLEGLARMVVELLAMAGRPVPRTTLRRAAEADHEALHRALGVLRAGTLVRAEGPDGNLWRTQHDRILETIVAHLPSGVARERHRALALALEAEGGADLEALVDHWREAGDRERAAALAVRCAELSMGALAFERAARLYRQAIELGGDSPSAQLRIRLADALASHGSGRAAADAYLAGTAGASEATVLELRRKAAEQLLVSGHTDDGISEIQSVLASVGMRLPQRPWFVLASLLFQRLLLLLRGLRFASREEGQISARDRERIAACWAAGVGLSMVDNLRGAYFQVRHLRLSLDAGQPHEVVRGLSLEALFSASLGAKRARRVERITRRVRGIIAADPAPPALDRAWLVAAQGCSVVLLGRFSEAAAPLAEAERIFREQCTGVAWELRSVQLVGLWTSYFTGDLRSLSSRAPALAQEARVRGDLYASTNFSTGLPGLAALIHDQPERLRQAGQGVLAGWSHAGVHIQHLFAMHAIASAALYAGSAREALASFEALWPGLVASMILRVALARLILLDLRARIALQAAHEATDDRVRASHLRAASRLARRLGRLREPWGAPSAGLIRGLVQRQRGRFVEARRLLEGALVGFQAAQMGLHAGACSWAIGRLGGADDPRARAAEEWAKAEGVVRPERFLSMLAPGA